MSVAFTGRGILLDIEGTTSSVRFVYDVMFPYVREHLSEHLNSHWGAESLRAACQQIAADAQCGSPEELPGADAPGGVQAAVTREVLRLMDNDVKATGLKQLQGLIWESGFKSGELQAHVYDDVPNAIRQWRDAGLDIRIYSSGSIQAQKLFFGHSVFGNLLAEFSGHYDTTTGGKKEAGSYSAIASDWGLPPNEILFLSDVVAELDAAKEAGLQTALSVRPGNASATEPHDHRVIESFAAVQ